MKDEMEIQGRLYESSLIIMERYGLSKLGLYRWQKRGLLPPPTRIGGRNYYVRDDVEARLALGE